MVQLVEIPTNGEIHDNIVAYWLSEKPTRAGDALSFRYRLHWLDTAYAFPTDALAKVVATRMGRCNPRPTPVIMRNVYGQPLVELVKCCGAWAREDTSSRGERE
jgi:glucan biosynthesis protein